MPRDTYEPAQALSPDTFCPATGTIGDETYTVYSSAELHRIAKHYAPENMRTVRWALSLRDHRQTMRLVCKARDGSLHTVSVAL